MSIINNTLLLGSGDEGYNLTRSLRFRASAGGHLSKTFSAAGDQKTFTISKWLKRGALGIDATFFASVTDANNFLLIYYQASTDKIIILGYSGGSAVINISTSAVFRDPSAWYHLVFAFDTTQATGSNRVKLYVNNTQQSVTFTNTPSLNLNALPSTTRYIGRAETAANYFDGYLTEVNFIDGQALTPSSFGETDLITGVWKPKRYVGTYGTNGFYLPFTDNSALTTSSNAGLGKDFSGNGNYWTTNNISITAGVTYGSMTDVPTLTSPTAANFCVLNPVNKSPSSTVSNGNLRQTSSGGWYRAYSTIFFESTAAFYAEATMTSLNSGSNGVRVGVANANSVMTYLGSDANSWSYDNQGGKYTNGTLSSYGSSFVQGDIIGILFNNGSLTFYKNGVSQGVAYSGLTGTFCFAGSPFDTDTVDWNFGQRPFSYSLPSGALALNTFNLPNSTIVKGSTSMNAVTWSGASSGTNLNVTGFGFQPDFVWGKNRSGTYDHFLQDAVRGITNGLSSNLTAAESTTSGSPTSFISDGFNISSTAGWSSLGNSNVTWAWKANGAGSTNTSGTITSTVSVNASAGFSVVTYTGTGANATFGHGLGVAPSMVIVKSRSNGSWNWGIWHQSLTGSTPLLRFTTGQLTNSFNVFRPASNTSSVFAIGDEVTSNENGGTYVAYCWTTIAGFSSFGSYTGNGSSDGSFIYTGFKPKFLLIKKIATGGGDRGWLMEDTSRSPYNAAELFLYANSSDAESNSQQIDFLSNGFKIRNNGLVVNDSGVTMIYAAFASNPFRNSLAN
jgi:hypothetical protein